MDGQLIKRFIILGVFLGALFGAIFGWRTLVAMKMQEEMASAGPRRVSVTVAPVERVSWSSQLQAIATLQAVQGTVLTPQLEGMVTGIHFKSGASVKKGQLLVQLNDANEQAQLEHDESALQLARVKLAQQHDLYKNNNTSELDLQQAETNYAQVQAAINSDRATIAKLQVRAPFDGHLGLRQVSLGQYVETSTPVVDLQQWDPIYAVFQVPQQQLTQLATGRAVQLRVAGIDEREFTGTITAIGAQVLSGTRNIRVQATLANPDAALRPGMYGEVTVHTGEARDVLAVPDSAVAYNTYGSYLYVIEQVEGDLVAQQRNVQTDVSRDGLTIITRGVEADERVVTSGQVKLRTGAAVSILQASADDAQAGPVAARGSVGSGR